MHYQFLLNHPSHIFLVFLAQHLLLVRSCKDRVWYEVARRPSRANRELKILNPGWFSVLYTVSFLFWLTNWVSPIKGSPIIFIGFISLIDPRLKLTIVQEIRASIVRCKGTIDGCQGS